MVCAARCVQTFSRRGLATGTAEGEQQVEELWQDLFLYPSLWWDNRCTKTNPAYPDFRHKLSRHPLWIDNRRKPAWVDAQLPFLHHQHAHHAAHHSILHPQGYDPHAHHSILHAQGHDHHTQHAHHAQNHDHHTEHAHHSMHYVHDHAHFTLYDYDHYTGYVHHPMHHTDHHNHRTQHVHHSIHCAQNHNYHTQHVNHPMHHTLYHFDELPHYQQSRAQSLSSSPFNTFYHNDQLQLSVSHPEHLSRASNALSHMRMAPSTATYMGLLKACINSKSFSHAKQVSSYLISNNTPLNGLLGDYLVVTLAKCGAIDDALEISATLPHRTVFSWTAMISAYVERGHRHEALQLFKRMSEDGVEPNHFTFVSLFQACGSIPDLEQGKKLHADARHRGLLSNLFVGNSLISMYAKCMAIKEAEDAFSTLLQRDVVSWNTMLSAYAEQGQAEKALRLYRQLHEDGGSPDHLTLMSAVQACSILVGKEKAYGVKGCAPEAVALEIGQALHAEARKKSRTLEVVLGTALVILYGKCGEVAFAEQVFCASSHRDMVIWNAMLGAYLEQGHGEKALHLYAHMQKECMTLDEVTCIYSLQACGEVGNLEICNELHFDIASAGCDSIQSMVATLIQTYRSCACMLDAQALFNALSDPDHVTWTTCIAGHAGDGNSIESLHMFEHMRFAGIKPDEILFTAVLSACSHGGLVAEGLQYFESLRVNYGVHPNLKHYGIMLDLLGRAGNFKGVDTLLKQMPMEADVTIWLSLLGACRMHSHVELAKHAFEHVVSLQPEQTFAYILMANIYIDAGLQDCAVDVEIARHKIGAGTKPIHGLLDDELYTYS